MSRNISNVSQKGKADGSEDEEFNVAVEDDKAMNMDGDARTDATDDEK